MIYYLAIDIGASSGQHIVGWLNNVKINTEEVYRFAHDGRPTSEFPAHLMSHIARLKIDSENRVVMHCHPTK